MEVEKEKRKKATAKIPNRLSKWMSKWTAKKVFKEKQNELPARLFRASHHPTVLTPSPSHESLLISAASATEKSAFFRRLPFEIRRQILTDAFGDRTVHMGLFSFPIANPNDQSLYRADPSHRPHDSTAASPSLPVKFDSTKPRQLRWWGGVCQRMSPPPLLTITRPFYDSCCQRSLAWCKFWPGEALVSHILGAMGWLLSCRQAYAEGIDVLFSTNKIHPAGNLFIRHLPQLLPPQRLASISSLSITWELRVCWDDSPQHYPAGTGFPPFHQMLEMLPRNFPRLKKLVLELQGDVLNMPKVKPLEAIESTIMGHIDHLVRSLGPHLHECEVVFPLSLFNEWRRHASTRRRMMMIGEPGYADDSHRLWREIPTSVGGTAGDESRRLGYLPGYWLYVGQDDSPRYYTCTMCTGFSSDD